MIFGGKKKNWDDQYDEYYTQIDPEYDRRVKPILWIHFAALATMFTVFLVIVGAFGGGVMVEKLLKSLCTPVGGTWLILATMIYFSLVFKAGKTALGTSLCWLLLTIGGNWWTFNLLAQYLESPYREPVAIEQPLDAVLVLGGGTENSPTAVAQLSAYGDRVTTAARVYHSGMTQKIIASGMQSFRNDPNDLHPNEESIQILKELKIPESDLRRLGGRNTSEEIQELKKWIETLPDQESTRIGLVTSAWHMARATKLAESNGISVTPIPSNFLSQPYAPNPGIIVPSAGNLEKTSKLIHEILGRWIGR